MPDFDQQLAPYRPWFYAADLGNVDRAISQSLL